MKLWEVKAQSLRLMFADSDMEFSEQEFAEGVVYSNFNTRDKLIRMDDSIRRGIDIYNNKVGQRIKFDNFGLTNGVIILGIKNQEPTDVDTPTKVDLIISRKYETQKVVGGVLTDVEITETVKTIENIHFVYFDNPKYINFIENDYSTYLEEGYTLDFRIWYIQKPLNIPYEVDEMTYDLSTIYIPENVQRMLPHYVKGELYEEDEEGRASASKNEYLNFISSLRKPYTDVKTKVKTNVLFRRR